MNNYDAYLFDWDGTLCNTLPIWLDIVRAVLGPHAKDWSDKEIALRIFGRVRQGLADAGVPTANIDASIAAIAQAAYQRMPSGQLYPHVRPMLRTLQSHGKKGWSGNRHSNKHHPEALTATQHYRLV